MIELRGLAALIVVSIGIVVWALPWGAMAATLRLGRIVVLGRDRRQGFSGPQLAMNPSGQYSIYWSGDGYVGPLWVASGSTSDGVDHLRAAKFGTLLTVDAGSIAVSASGRRAFDYDQYRRNFYAPRVGLWFRGSASETWTRRILSGPHDVEATEAGPVFDHHERILDAFEAKTHSATKLELVRESRPGGPFHRLTIFRDRQRDGLKVQGIAVDRKEHPVIAFDEGSWSDWEFNPIASMVITTDSRGRLRRAQRLGSDCGYQSLALTPSGEAAVALVCQYQGKTGVFVSERWAGGRFGPLMRLYEVDSQSGSEQSPSILIQGDRVLVSWEEMRFHMVDGTYDHHKDRVLISSAPFGAQFHEPWYATPYFRSSSFTYPNLIKGNAGRLYLLEYGPSGAGLRPLTKNGLGRSMRLAPTSDTVSLATDAHGHGIATWDATGRQPYDRLEARAFTLQ